MPLILEATRCRARRKCRPKGELYAEAGRGLKENDLLNYHFADFSIDELGHASLGHQELVF